MMAASACELSCATDFSGSPNVECSTDGGNFTINGSCEGSLCFVMHFEHDVCSNWNLCYEYS